MREKPPQPTLLKIALQDQVVGAAGFFGIVLIVSTVLVAFVGDVGSEVMAILTALIVLCLVIAAWRLIRRATQIRRIWERGVRRPAFITSLQYMGYGRSLRKVVLYQYEFGGKMYRKREIFMPRWQPPISNVLDIIVDPERPDKPLIVDNYL